MNPDPVAVGIVLSDLVIQEQGTGKYSLIGCFNVLHSVNFPFIAPRFFVTILLTNLPQKIEQFSVTVRVEASSTGHVLTSMSANLKPPPEFVFPQQAVMELPFPIPQFAISEPANYTLIVLVDNEIVGRRPFPVAGIPKPPTPQIQ